jgi:agmatinase
MRTEDPQVVAWNDAACSAGLPVIREGGSGGNPVLQAAAREVDELSEQLAGWLRQQALNLIGRGKIVGIVGGDHSVSLGALQAHAQAYEHLGVLHIDAHADLRVAYEGFRYSHASIMDNVLRLIDPLERLVQVGIRDLSPAEYERTHQAGVTTYFDHGLRRRLHSGQPWADVCREIVSHLPTDVYVTFDIDGLDPALCPGTGTPVPGGLSYPQVLTLLATIVEAGKRVVGFDLVEVAPGDGQWDGNVGARVLYRLCCLAMLGRM